MTNICENCTLCIINCLNPVDFETCTNNLYHQGINPLPNDKNLDVTKLKAFTDNWLNVTKRMISVFNNPLPDMPILGSSNSAANEDVVSKLLTNVDTIF